MIECFSIKDHRTIDNCEILADNLSLKPKHTLIKNRVTPAHLVKIFLFVFYLFLRGVNVQAQSFGKDTLLLSGYRIETSYFYCKPVIGLHWSYSTKEGDSRFSDSDQFDRRNSRYGLLVGYHLKRFDLETGLITFPVYTGFRFLSDPNFTVGSGVRVTYWHFPAHFQYTLWRVAKRVAIRAITGVAFNSERGQSLLPSRSISSYMVTNPDGSVTMITSSKETYFRTQFVSATVGLGLTYQLLNRIDLSLQVNRLLSGSVVRQVAQLQQNNDPTVYRISTQAGAAGLSMLVGLAYRFNQAKTYKTRE